ncbi:hypothetical protein BO70DRAFT_387190 [Aspergillus heteromorphus CBS 117.55]|uniref:Amidohydrolase-related domain-containing protein n=1 Tax=Aspergillus heteromorphus CBS 117.55 TaxID=1448321 RepID=A0A317W5Y1_9EURO|nr:uncharacterized protein BO70DRAFT_387190 [Aspergillus heteromorphus CBS 117.55]PWY82004.1 hypothetical protein BO70DRAFT_387190 [Aspergillus heteromorphus CBS 117.55]
MEIPRGKPWSPQTPPPDLTFIHAHVVDVETSSVIRDATVRVREGRIVSVTPHGTTASLAPGSQLVDLAQRHYLCPGLIDCHVHLTATPGGVSLRELFAASPNALAYRTAYVAREMLLRGFTTVRDTGGADAALREAIADGLLPGPRLFIAGHALSQTGGHGDFRASYQGEAFKCCGGQHASLARVCDGVPACLAAVRDELRQGADFIKIMCGGGVATPTDALDMLQFTPEEIRAITTTAAYSGKYVTAHAYTVEAIRHAVDNGVRGIEHGNFIDRETAEYCQARGVVFTPTLVTYHGMTQPAFAGFLDEFSQRKNQEVLRGGLRALTVLRDAGALICYGSDLLAGMHPLQNQEFSIRAAALSAGEILQSATVNAARSLGMAGQLGSLREGSIADLLILNANPLEDIGVLDRIQQSLVGLLKAGRVVTVQADGVDGLSVDPIYDPCRARG